MKEIFDTKTSLNKFKYLPLFVTIALTLPSIFFGYKSGSINLMKFLTSAFGGFCLGLVLFLYMWISYRNVFFEITDDYISKKKGINTIRSVSVKNVEYYFYSDREKYPKLKVRNEKDFDFEMTLGADTGIITALEKLGINKKL